MESLRAVSLLPFVPSGKEYDASRQLFRDLGFQEVWESDGYARFRNGPAEFILQKYENQAFAENPTFKIKPPADFPWGREVNFIDLAGVCWHVGQRQP